MTIKGDGQDEAQIFGLPFLEPAQIAHFLGDPEIKTFDQATRAICSEMLKKVNPHASPILLSHAFVVGGEASDSERDLFVGGSSFVDVRAFDGFAYTALGHLHKPQAAGRDNVRYSGSLLTYSISEIAHTKSVTEIQIVSSPRTRQNSKPHLEIIQHPLESSRKLRYIEAKLEEIISLAANDQRTDDYIIAALTDSGPVVDALTKLRAVYPNLLHVSRAESSFQLTESPALDRVRERAEVDELDLFAEFVCQTTGTEMSPSERDALVDVIRELDLKTAEAPTA